MLKDLYIGESGDGFVEKPVGGRSYVMEIEMAVLQSAWIYNGPPQLAPKEAPLSSAPCGVKGICPPGWHFPSDGEREHLALYWVAQSGLGTQDDDEWGGVLPILKKYLDGICPILDRQMATDPVAELMGMPYKTFPDDSQQKQRCIRQLDSVVSFRSKWLLLLTFLQRVLNQKSRRRQGASAFRIKKEHKLRQIWTLFPPIE